MNVSSYMGSLLLGNNFGDAGVQGYYSAD